MKMTSAALASASVFAITISLAATAPAAAQATAPAATADEGVTEIVVTARRQNENVQDVPVSIVAVSASVLQQEGITQVAQIANLTPGLTIRNDGVNEPTLILRGIRWDRTTGTSAIPIYQDDIDFSPGVIFATLYDTQQVEVLRGPQGTTRGAPSIAGAITIQTKLPDLESFGGFAYGEVGEGNHEVLQGAVNIPIINDELGIRLAGSAEHSDNQIRSINDHKDPRSDLLSGRATVLWQPSDDLTFTAMYEKVNQNASSYAQVEGTGSPGVAGDPLLPPGYNIAPRTSISAKQRLSVQESPYTATLRTDLASFKGAWNVLGQRLEYTFGYQADNHAPFTNPYDPAHLTSGNIMTTYGTQPKPAQYFHHEVRLSSAPGTFSWFDYAVGFYSNFSRGSINYAAAEPLPGAFGDNLSGAPLSPILGAAGQIRYAPYLQELITLDTNDHSEYANVQFHIPDDIELAGGVRFITDTRPASVNVATLTGFANGISSKVFGGKCPAVFGLDPSPVYAGECEAAFTGPAVPYQYLAKTYNPTIWNASLSHKFTPDIMGYFTAGTSWRQGLPALGSFGLPSELLFPQPESATSYELGVKSSWLDDRFLLNADIYQIDYTNELVADGNAVAYFSSTTNAPAFTTAGGVLSANINSQVRGIEADAIYRPIDDLTLEANVSYSRNISTGGQIPCSVGPTPTAAHPVNYCPELAGAVLNSAAPFQGSFNANYTHQIGELEGYVRLVANYQGPNPAFGVSSTSEKAYSIVDLFVGLTGNDGGWDAGLYAKNLFNTNAVLAQQDLPDTLAGFSGANYGPTGLQTVQTTAPREVGVQLRYAFGSR